MSEDWLKIVKEKLDSYESEVPSGAWDEIESRLFPAETPRVRFMPWVWAFAAAAALAFGVFAGLRLLDHGNGQVNTVEDNRTAVIETESPTSPDTNPSSSVDNEGGQASSVPGRVEIIPAPVRSAIAAVLPEEILVPDGNEFDAVPVTEIPVTVTEEVPEVEEREVEEKAEVIEDKDDTGFKTDHDGEDWSGYMSATDDRPHRDARKTSAGFSLSSAARSATEATTLDTKSFFLGVASNFESQTKGDESIFTRTVSTPVSKDENHSRPVRMALMLEFPLTDVLSLESGLSYSVLHSSFTTSSGSRTSQEQQMLGYLGIPLNLKANLWDKDVFTVYAKGGGMVEKCINGVSKTVITVSGTQSGDPTRRTFSVKPPVWSVNASAGMQINLPGSLGIYAEPGISYHFPYNSSVKSIYSEKPFDFILSFGARFSFR